MSDVIEFEIDIPLLAALRAGAELFDEPELRDLIDRFEDGARRYFRSPALMTVEEFTPVANTLLIGWQKATGEDQGAPFPPSYFVRMREAALANRRPRTAADKLH